MTASLSARRAWIENFYYADKDCDWVVALRKESVDRKVFLTLTVPNVPMSLSARRAWIEKFCQRYPIGYFGVALRKESVDRKLPP